MQSIAILGATGSIGSQALDFISKHSERFRVAVLSASTSAEALFQLVRAHRPLAAALVVEPSEIPSDLRDVQWFFGDDASERAIRAVKPDYALCAVVGIAGLSAVMTALDVCSRVLLANKEALVTGGELVMRKACRAGVQMLPVDSEHSAIFQCLQAAGDNRPARLILTASGGPFRTWDEQRIKSATVADALGHPTWRMGAKITVDCATMMNKGLELIEAHHLFDTPMDLLDVIVHPESVIHSMVEFEDGAVLAQLGTPDMRTAIGYAMSYPDRRSFGGEQLDFAKIGQLHFEQPNVQRFPCLRLAREAQQAGGNMPVVLNGANEMAVAAFLDGRIPFGQIAEIVDHALQHAAFGSIESVEDVYAADRSARALAQTRL